MYKDVLRSIDDVSLFPVIAILIFMIFFAVLLIYVIRMDKQSVKQMAGIPLAEAERVLNPTTQNHSLSPTQKTKSHA